MSPSELDAFRRGDRALYRRLVERHSPRLLTVALAYTRDPDEAHDAVQEVWVRAYQSRQQLETAGSFVGCAEGTVKASLHQALQNLSPILRSWRDVVVSWI